MYTWGLTRVLTSSLLICFLHFKCLIAMLVFRMPAVELSEEQKMEPLRKRVKDHHFAAVQQTKEKFQDVLAELFFLQNGGNMMDLGNWKKKPPASYFEFVKMTPLEVPITLQENVTFVSPAVAGMV